MIIHRALPARATNAPRAPHVLPRRRALVPWARWGVIVLLALVAVGTVSCIMGCQASACTGSATTTHTCERGAGASGFKDTSSDAPGTPFMHVCYHTVCHALTLPLAALVTGFAVAAVLQIISTFARPAACWQSLAPPS